MPTEAEWEKAARGGLVGKRYPWGDQDPNPSKANYLFSFVGATTPVGEYPPNGYGLYKGNHDEVAKVIGKSDTISAFLKRAKSLLVDIPPDELNDKANNWRKMKDKWVIETMKIAKEVLDGD